MYNIHVYIEGERVELCNENDKIFKATHSHLLLINFIVNIGVCICHGSVRFGN